MPAAAPLLLLHAICWWPLVLFLLLPPLPLFALTNPPTFISLHDSRLNHLLQDSSSGYVYVGAVNALYHLSSDLQLISWGKTGPTLDSPDCLPPIEPKDCSQARQTDNINQLLLLEKQEGSQAQRLIVCGTVLQGICEKRSLANVSQVLYHTANPVDTQYVAANDPRVSTVAVLTEHRGTRLMLVGRGYTSKGPGGIPPITTRRLEQYHSSPAFSHEELGKLVVGSYSEYNNQFVKALHHGTHIYFLFSRRDTLKTRDYQTYISRLCAGDPSFYSYVEVPLSCTGGYNLAQAAAMGTYLGKATIFVAMAAGQASTPTPTARSALCAYSMEELDQALKRAQVLCYTQEGKGDKEKEAYIAYEVSSKCLKLPPESVSEYPCGGEHTPSPIASAVPLQATPAKTWTTQLTAVAVATEAGHTIALLGDKSGQLHKVFVHENGSGSQYDSVMVDPQSPVNADLLLDSTLRNVYVMTEKKVTRLPVAQCERHSDCHSCLSVRDPYCGWCSLEGRCTRKLECARHSQPHHWLWSYGHDRQCVSIQSLDPAIQSREEQTQVSFMVQPLPALSEDESLSCAFGTLPAEPAVVEGNRITCQSPSPMLLPPSPPGSDHMTIRLALMFGKVTVSGTNITFYDCRAVGRLNATSPCMACVSSEWPCHWCARDELCTHNHSCPQQHIIYNSREKSEPHGADACPCVWALESSALIPVGVDTQLLLQGKNLDIFKGDENYECVVVIEGQETLLHATLDRSKETGTHVFKCATHKFQYTVKQMEYLAPVYLQRGTRRIDSAPHLRLQLYNCSVGQSDCSQCRAVPEQYHCVWCGGQRPRCVFHESCSSITEEDCPPPLITEVWPLTGPLEGGIVLTILGSNLGQRYEDIQNGVTVAGVTCKPLRNAYLISTRIMCELQPSTRVTAGPVVVSVGSSEPGQSQQTFTYQNPELIRIVPSKGPRAGGTRLTVHGAQLLTGQGTDLRAFVGSQPCHIVDAVSDTQLVCRTSHSNQTAEVPVRVQFGTAERTVGNILFHYLEDPVITDATPTESFHGGGRNIMVTGQNLDVVQQPMMSVRYETMVRRQRYSHVSARNIPLDSAMATKKALCVNVSSEQMSCPSPQVPAESRVVRVWFEMDNVHLDFESIKGAGFKYHPDPQLYPLNRESPTLPIRFKPGGVLAVEGKGLTLAMSKDEVVARLGDKICDVKTLDDTHLYCEPPEEQPLSLDNEELPRLKVVMGQLEFNLGTVEYDVGTHTPVPLEAQVGLGAGAAVVVLIVLVIILMYRRKSKQAMRDYKKVLVQLETLEINVGDQCRKEFTDLMTEMMDLSSDVGGPGIPFLDYRTYAERIFFPGQRGAPLSQNLDLPESRRQTVEQGLGQLNNLLNNRLFLTRFIHTLEEQQNFSQRDRGYVASLLTMALHDKLEYFTDVMKTLLGDLVQQYVAKNPKLMLRRTETVVEKMLTNWMSICLYSFLKEVAGEPLYMLYRAIKYQVDKGPVDAVTGKAKRTLNDSHLLREDIDYCSITLTVLVKSGVEVQPCPVKVLDIDTITQVKDKILDQIYKGAPFSQRPSADSLDLEWRSGQAGHLTLSDDDVTGIVHGHWKRLNTLQHYKVPDGATVALIPRSSAGVTGINQIFQTGESKLHETPMLEGEEDEGLRLWHLVKSSEDPEIPKHRKSSMRERERAKAIPEIYLTRLLSMKGTLQKFVDDVFVAILSTKRPPPIAVRFFFDFLDDMAEKHGIDDPETVHIWKTNSLPLRFWVNILKNPQFVFDVQVTDSVDAVLSVIAQTFIDSCTTSEHKVGRDSPVNKLLYAREIPRYKQLVERYYSDIHSAASGCYQEMNSMLTELSGSFASEMNSLVALHELYKYINKYYDQIIMALEEDPAGQKMQLAYRLQQVAALVENKVTDL
ncbi:plexin-B3 isoform X1 [Pangasianodon hypophthalmus]|uniref:plexin-B3 isoform X1 n=2 Tax=Pangasianodon hypophthalmus TaxID=310915 RepID=UPI0023074DD7|nr:plexin-B3 isoform X1 [Pangasianodon hypophthalmus]XP_053091890.1 plexin-B3 isoform X1 [Pangasianodon hypophthalmus]